MKKKIAFTLISLISAILVFVGPWPVNETVYENSTYAQKTFQRIHTITPTTDSGPLLVGTAKIDITPSPGIPLGGNAARNPKENIGHIEKVFARAISIGNGKHTITIISPEFLLPLPELVDEVLTKTKLQRNEIYFSATHTHSGPGGFANGIIAEQTLGKFSPQYFDTLTSKLAKTILESRQSLQAAVLHYSRLQLNPETIQNYLHNQLGSEETAHNTIHVLQVKNRHTQKSIANLITFSMHPTILGRTNRNVSGDYPSLIMKNLDNKISGLNIFTIGAPGGITPTIAKIRDGDFSELQKRNYLGDQLSNLLINALTNALNGYDLELTKTSTWSAKESIIQSELIKISLPSANYRISDNWRLSPYFVQMLFHDESTYIHALRIGKLFLLSYPADFSGILAKRLENWGDSKNILPWINSFNGDYVGYIMPSEFEGMDSYVMRDVNFYGPWAGDYFMALSKNIMQQLNETQ